MREKDKDQKCDLMIDIWIIYTPWAFDRVTLDEGGAANGLFGFFIGFDVGTNLLTFCFCGGWTLLVHVVVILVGPTGWQKENT